MASLRIIGLSVVAACLYGVVHDQITARICLEYFTIGHPRLVAANSPTIHGFLWGVIATWWVGLILGILLAAAARFGRPPKISAAELLRPLCVLFLAAGTAAVIAGSFGHWLATRGDVQLAGLLATRVPVEQHVNFITAWWAHMASYAVGFLGGLVILVYVLLRRRAQRLVAPPSAP